MMRSFSTKRVALLAQLVGVVLGLVVLTIPARSQSLQTQVAIAINRLTTGVTPFTRLRLGAGSYLNWGTGTDTLGYGIRDNAGVIETKNSGGAWLPLPTSSTLPTAASFLTRVAEANLSNETALGALTTGLLVNTTTTGIPTIYAGTTCTNQFVQALSALGAATCASVSLTTDTTGTLPVANGGTNLISGTSGGVLGYTAAGVLASSAALTINRLLLGGGAGALPTVLGSLGTTTTLLHGNAAGAPTFAAVSLTADISGILPSANGGTANAFFTVAGPTTTARTFTFPDQSTTILTTANTITVPEGGTGYTNYTVGDLLGANATNTLTRINDIATGNALISGGVATLPTWGKIGLTTHVTGTLPATNGGTGLAAYTTGQFLQATSTTTLAGTTTPTAARISFTATALAALGTPADGSVIYCSDCLYNSNPCTAASTGALAKRIAGAWRCD